MARITIALHVIYLFLFSITDYHNQLGHSVTLTNGTSTPFEDDVFVVYRGKQDETT